MGNNLERVGVSFTSEGAVNFVKTLKEVNSAISDNMLEFKKAQAQWDKTTPATEKLNFQIKNLGEAIELQKEKALALRKEIENLENAETKDEKAAKKNQEQINKKRKELEKTEVKIVSYTKKMEALEKQLNNTGKKIEDFGEKVQNVGGKIEKAGSKLSAFSGATGAALLASAKSAIDFEDAFTGVEKTVDGTAEQMAELKQGIRDMAKEIPSSTTEISAVAEAAGQLGIKTENILEFSRAMIDLGNSTNLSADEAASQLAKFANIMQMSQKDFNRLGSSIVDLGNHYATTEADIVSMSMRLAGAGKQVGLSEGQVLGLATALSSVGIEAEMGGSAISKAMVKMQNAVEMGGDKLNKILKKTGMSLRDLELLSSNNSKDFKKLANDIGMTSTELKQFITAGTNLEDFAKISGMSAEEFKRAWKNDATGALTAFIKGLGDAENKGESAITMLTEMGLTEVRLRDSLLRAANAGDLFNSAIETGTRAWEENTALTNEANKRYSNLKSKIEIAMNKIKDIAITLGNKLMPSIEKIINKVGDFAKHIESLNEEQIDMILKIGLVVTALGPFLKILGSVTSVAGTAIKGIGTFTQAIGIMTGSVSEGSTAAKSLAGFIKNLVSPLGLATTALGVAAGAAIYFSTQETEAQKAAKGLAQEVSDSRKQLDDYNKSVDESMNAELAHVESVGKLKDELSQLVDENGRVEEKNKGRVSFILNEMNEALGTEYSLNGDIIESYQKLQNEIDATIEKEKARIILNSKKEKYSKALEDETKHIEEARKSYEEIGKYGITPEEIDNTIKQWEKDVEQYEKSVENARLFGTDEEYARALHTKTGLMEKYTKKDIEALRNLGHAYDDSMYQVKKCTEAKKDYEQSYADFAEGNYEQINQTVTVNTENWCDKSLEEIRKSIGEQEKYLEYYKDIYEKTGNEVALANSEQAKENMRALAKELADRTSTVDTLGKEEIRAWYTLAHTNYEIYQEQLGKMSPEMQEQIGNITGIIYGETPDASKATEFMVDEILDRLHQDESFKQEALNSMYAYLNGLNDTELKALLKSAGVQDVDRVIQGIRSGNLAEGEGIKILESLNTGLKNTKMQGILNRTASSLSQALSKSLTPKVSAGFSNIFKALPGHKDGLDYVPQDNYIARLHKGERVLTKEENKEYTAAENGINVSNSNVTNNTFGGGIDYGRMTEAFLKALNSCKLEVDEDGFAKIVENKIYEVM